MSSPPSRPATSPAASVCAPAASAGTASDFCPRVGPVALYGLLFTIVMLFALQGDAIANHPLDVVLIAVPLLVYFLVMFFASFWTGRAIGLGYALWLGRRWFGAAEVDRHPIGTVHTPETAEA